MKRLDTVSNEMRIWTGGMSRASGIASCPGKIQHHQASWVTDDQDRDSVMTSSARGGMLRLCP